MEEELLTPSPVRGSCSLHPPSPVLTHEQEKKRKEIGSQHFFLEKSKIMQKKKRNSDLQYKKYHKYKAQLEKIQRLQRNGAGLEYVEGKALSIKCN